MSEALDKIVGNGLFWIWIIGNAALVMASDSSAAFLHGGRFWGYLIIFNITVISIGLLYVQLLAGPRWKREYENEQIEHNKEKMAEENMILDLIRMAEEKGLNLVNELNLHSLYEKWKTGNWNEYGLWHDLEEEIQVNTHAIQIKQRAFENEIYDDEGSRPTYEQKQNAWNNYDIKHTLIKTTDGTFWAPGGCMRCGFTFMENHFRGDLPLGFYWAGDNSGKLLIFCSECAPKMKARTNNSNKPSRSRHISESVKDSVWNRDGGKCVECGSNENLEFDHIIPFSKGGANTKRNIQLLCESCNRSKSDSIG